MTKKTIQLSWFFILCAIFIVGCADKGADSSLNRGTDVNSDSSTADSDTEDICDTDVGDELMIWISIPGGTFVMGDVEGSQEGTDTATSSDTDQEAGQSEQITIESFEISQTEVTVTQYAACVDHGCCTEPDTNPPSNNWGAEGREEHPVNKVQWQQAVTFCGWVGGSLPSESQWEYAARSGGKNKKFPWGDATATCELAIMDGPNTDGGCDLEHTWSTCSKTDGNTEQGLCDMGGNVWEWIQDQYHSQITDVPLDGSPWEGDSQYSGRVVRGGAYYSYTDKLETTARNSYPPETKDPTVGFRCIR